MGDFFAFRWGGVLLKGPSADGTAGQFLQTDGSGATSFATVNTDITGTTAGAPSPAVDGDSDTGLFSPAPDVLAFAAGGVEGLRVTESGGGVTFDFSGPAIIENVKVGKGSGSTSTVCGDGATASNTGSSAFGRASDASGLLATAVGYICTASKLRSAAYGARANAALEGDIAFAALTGGNEQYARIVLQGSDDTQAFANRTTAYIEGNLHDATNGSHKGEMVLGVGDSTADRPCITNRSDGSRGHALIQAHATAPADTLLPNSSVAFYDDGSGNLAIKLKDGSGTVRTGTVTLS